MHYVGVISESSMGFSEVGGSSACNRAEVVRTPTPKNAQSPACYLEVHGFYDE